MKYKELKDWDCIKTKEGVYLKSKLLSYFDFKHVFFGKTFNNQKPKELSKFLNNGLTIHFAKQIHGNKVIKASDLEGEQVIEADAIISNRNNQSLWVYTADCIPVLIGDKRTRQVSACHAGWRGISNKLIVRTIKELILLGSNIENIIVALGPAISINHYEVGIEVANSIYNSLSKEKKHKSIDYDIYINELIKERIIKVDNKSQKLYIDIRIALKTQLRNSGLSKKQVSICPICTYSNSDFFYSRRRNKNSNIQWSGIASQF